jgi:hypothetical protein
MLFRMNNTPHTSGPWESHSASLSDNTLVVTAKRADGDGYERICTVRDGADRDYSDDDYRAQANSSLISAAPDAERILRHLFKMFQAGEPLVYEGCLMPDDGYDGAGDEQTLADAIAAYIEKVEGR